MPAPELAIQSWLRQRASLSPDELLQLLDDRYSISHRRSQFHPELVLLKYSQIESPFKEAVVQDCRGLILDTENDWAVVCMTYRKFFNAGEPLAAPIHWPSALVCEKLDGSLIQVYWYKGRWHAATSGVPDATCQVGDFGVSFNDLFWATARARGLRVDRLDRRHCYAFELCTAINRVVVRHDSDQVFLHGVRHLPTMQERDPDDYADLIGVPRARRYPLTSLEECLQQAREMDPLAQEGYVVVDRDYNRIKVKSPAYVALHHAKDGLLSRRAMANVIRRGEADELRAALEAFPELSKEFEELKVSHEQLIFDSEVIFGWILIQQHKGAIGLERKCFAAEAGKHPRLAGALFHLLDKSEKMVDGRMAPPENIESALRAYYAQMLEKAYLRLVGVKTETPTEEIAA
jgi:hypothetical protein